MTINLKQIRPLDTNNIKLDKINYNFDQLIVNGGGPKGDKGVNGSAGPQGFQGASGAQGDRGVQGAQGPDADDAESFWDVVPQNLGSSNVMATLFASHPNTGTLPEFPAVVASGYITGNARYTSQQSNGLPNYQWVVNRRRNSVTSNLRFTSEGVVGNAFDITMDNFSGQLDPVSYKLRLGFIDNQNSQLNFVAKEHIIKSTDSPEDDLLKVSTTGGEINVDTIFEKRVEFNKSLSVDNSGAAANKIAVAVDNTGEVTFKTATEIGGSIRVGTIISILPSIFSDPTKFVCFQTITTAANPDVPIQIKMGAGIGDYVGWYVCNGKEWTNGSSINFQVPDLNSYSYQITPNPISVDPDSQGYVNVDNNEIHLIGGANINVIAEQVGVSSAEYDVSLTDTSNDPNVSSNNAGTAYKIKKLPQIIYLGVNNLYWSEKGINQALAGDYNDIDYVDTDYNVIQL